MAHKLDARVTALERRVDGSGDGSRRRRHGLLILPARVLHDAEALAAALAAAGLSDAEAVVLLPEKVSYGQD